MARDSSQMDKTGDVPPQVCGTVKIVAIIDECLYSRLAIEDFISGINRVNEVYTFSCFTDYKCWDQSRHNNKEECYVVINTSSASLYGDDVVSFLRYEKSRVDTSGDERPILLLRKAQGYLTYRNAILSHYLLQMQKSSLLSVVDHDRDLQPKKLIALLSRFIKWGTPYPGNYVSSQSVETLGIGDIRAIKIILDSRSISYWATCYGVNTKTLYTQRASLLLKLRKKMTTGYSLVN
ncbi:MAG: hypothetical protein RSG77_21590 [Hafnia sp.]